mgnify:FL=1
MTWWTVFSAAKVAPELSDPTYGLPQQEGLVQFFLSLL